jgi:hypothetical protein
MNVIESLTERIEDYRKSNSKPCKSYKTRSAAEKATAEAARIAGLHFDQLATPARYIVFFIPTWGRWVGALDFTEIFSRKTSQGGYLGVCPGFYSY